MDTNIVNARVAVIRGNFIGARGYVTSTDNDGAHVRFGTGQVAYLDYYEFRVLDENDN